MEKRSKNPNIRFDVFTVEVNAKMKRISRRWLRIHENICCVLYVLHSVVVEFLYSVPVI